MPYGDEHVFNPFDSGGGGYSSIPDNGGYGPGEDPTSIHNGGNPFYPPPNSGDGPGEGYWGGPGNGPSPGTSVWTNEDDPGGPGNYNPNNPSGYFPNDNENGNYTNNGGGGNTPIDPAWAMAPAALAQAYKQWNDAEKYRETAKEAMKYGDPFGQANREKYQNMFAETYSNPEKFLNDPGHQAKLKSGLDTVSRQDAMKGYLGSGNMAADLSAYTTNLNNQFLDQERNRLTPLMGAQFNPAAAGEFLMKGNDQSIASQNAALGSIFSIFGRGNANPGGGNTTIQNIVNGGKGGNAQGGGGGGYPNANGKPNINFPGGGNPDFSRLPGGNRTYNPGSRPGMGPDFNGGPDDFGGEDHNTQGGWPGDYEDEYFPGQNVNVNEFYYPGADSFGGDDPFGIGGYDIP